MLELLFILFYYYFLGGFCWFGGGGGCRSGVGLVYPILLPLVFLAFGDDLVCSTLFLCFSLNFVSTLFFGSLSTLRIIEGKMPLKHDFFVYLFQFQPLVGGHHQSIIIYIVIKIPLVHFLFSLGTQYVPSIGTLFWRLN